MKKIILTILIGFLIGFLFAVALSSAAQPQFVNIESGLSIEYQKFDTIKFNQSHEFNFHVYNSSNGFPITDGLSCYLHLYNSNGSHLAELFDNAASHNFDYSFNVEAGNFSNLGVYSYVVQCNNSAEGGFASVPLRVTPNGDEKIGDNFLIVFYILAIILVCALIYFIVINLAKLATSTTSVIDVAMSWAVYFIWLFTYWLATIYMPEITFTNFINSFLLGSVLALIYVVIPVISLIITMIYKGFEKKSPLSVEEMLGRRIMHGS